MPVTSMISSQSSEPPPPPPPPPPVLAPLAPPAVTVSVADAGAVLPSAGPVIRSLGAIEATYVPTVALFTLKEKSQLPPAGMLAEARVTLLGVLVSDSAAP